MLLFVPEFNFNTLNSKHSGYGHLMRCIRIALMLGGDILLNAEQQKRVQRLLLNFKSNFPQFNKDVRIVSSPMPNYRAVIVDYSSMKKKTLEQFLYYGPVIGIDMGGEARNCATYLVDTLPNALAHTPNLYAAGASVYKGHDESNGIVRNDMHRRATSKKTWSKHCKKILYYTESQDKEQEEFFLTALMEHMHKNATLTILAKEVRLYTSMVKRWKNFSVKEFNFDFHNEIEKYDLFISHFGISVYEAITSYVPTVILNHTEHHHMLSTMANFPYRFLDIGAGEFSNTPSNDAGRKYDALIDCIATLSKDDGAYRDLIDKTMHTKDFEDLIGQDTIKYIAEYIAEISDGYMKNGYRFAVNPWAGFRLENAVYRDAERTVFRCEDTNQHYQIPFSDNFPHYDSEYFLKNYKSQHGKTYIEDFSTILFLMRKRMRRIQKYLPTALKNKISKSRHAITGKKIKKYNTSENLAICDLGCAYGAMLNAATEYGYHTLGIDISKDVVTYCNKMIKSLAIQGNIVTQSIEEILKRKHKQIKDWTFSVVSMFYVLEHCPNIQRVLAQVQQMLSKGGLFVCSVPNGAGVSARKNRAHFYRNSPLDHFCIFTPRGLSKLLQKYGFRIVNINVTGHHPERFTRVKFLFPLFYLLSRVFRLGDTFEIYAQKER